MTLPHLVHRGREAIEKFGNFSHLNLKIQQLQQCCRAENLNFSSFCTVQLQFCTLRYNGKWECGRDNFFLPDLLKFLISLLTQGFTESSNGYVGFQKIQNYFIKDIKLDFSTDIGDFHHFYQRLTFGITSENSGKSTIFRQKLQAYLWNEPARILKFQIFLLFGAIQQLRGQN